MDQHMGHDPENAIMLDDNSNDRDIRGSRQASPHVVEYIDLQDDRYYKSCAYGPPSITSKDFHISTSQTRTNGTIVKIQKKPMIHHRGTTSYSYTRDRYQQLDTEGSGQDVLTNGMRKTTDVRARTDTTNTPGARNSSQQLQPIITGNGADVRRGDLSRVCQRAPSIPGSSLPSLQPFRREQVPNGSAHAVPSPNGDTAGTHLPQGERSAQASTSNAPKMGFAALEILEKARPAPFGTLKIDISSHREKEDQLFVSDSEDQSQGGDRLGSQDSNVPGQKSSVTQQKNVGKQGSPLNKQSAFQTQKSSRGNYITNKKNQHKEYRRLAREFVPTGVCGVFSESRVPAGCNPAQRIPSASELKRARNMTCIICGSKFDVKQAVRRHFPKCVQKNGNPNRHSWFDHPTIRNNSGYPTVRKNNGTQGRRLDDRFGPFSKKADDRTTAEPSSSLSGGLQADSSAAVKHRTTGGKGISDATIASWLAAQSENVDIEGDDNHSAETEMETLESAWQYHVTRQEIPTTDLGLIEPIERKYGPYWTLEEANMRAGEEIQIRDLSPPLGPHPRSWNLQFRKDENGLDNHTVEVQGTTITTTVTRSKSSSSKPTRFFSPTAPKFPSKIKQLMAKPPALLPRAQLTAHRIPASAFTTPPTIYTILSVSIHHTTLNTEIQTHGHYTLRNKANERAGEIWVEQFAAMEVTGAVQKYDLEREIRKEVRDLAEVEGELFDRIVGKNGDGEGEGARGRVWVVEEVVRGPRN